MISVDQKHVAIIGGGVSGLAAAKAFRDQGHVVVGFERSDTIGGVWDPKRAYPGVKTQSAKDLYRFMDMPMPDDYPEWPSGEQVLEYMKSYADKFDLMKLYRFDSTITSMEKREDGKDGWLLSISPSQGVDYKLTFDFVVICSGTFTNPKMISHPGQENFTNAGGIIKHSSEYKDLSNEDIQGKRVVVIGGSKSGTDIAVHAANRGARQVTVVMRTNLWRIPRFILGVNFKYLLYMRAQELQFSSWKLSSSILVKIMSFLAMPLVWMNFRMLELVLNFQLGLRKLGMVPNEKIEDAVCCGIPVVTNGFVELLQNGSIKAMNTVVRCYKAGGNDVTAPNVNCLILENGEKIEADIVIQATGWEMDMPFLSKDLKEKFIDSNDGLFKMYRFAVNPNLPNMGFVGLNSSFCSVLSSDMIARWLVRYADGMLANQPTMEEMESNIQHMLEWKRNVRPSAKVYGGACIAPFHFLHFDEILADVGAKAKKNSLFLYPNAGEYAKCFKTAPEYSVIGYADRRRSSDFDEKKSSD